MNRDNLLKLANYLEGPLVAKFDMSTYDSYYGVLSSTNCGTVGCALGHGPYAGIEKDYDDSWGEYCDINFDLSKSEWSWCFDSLWSLIDNTPIGASKRIKYLLSNGLPKQFNLIYFDSKNIEELKKWYNNILK